MSDVKIVMKCGKCGIELPEREIELSHDIPKYMGGTDKDGRHYLCRACHNTYELLVIEKCSEFFSEKFFPHEKIKWMIKISKQRGKLKEKFRILARETKEEFFKDERDNTNTQ